MKRKPNYFSSIISVAFVLFLLGFFAFLILEAKAVFTNLKENVEVNIYLEDNANEKSIATLSKQLKKQSATKSLRFISKDDALKEFEGEFELDFLEENPLPASLVLNVNETYAQPDSLLILKKNILKNSIVNDVVYQEQVVEILNKNIRNIALAILVASIVFLLIAIHLMDSAIRLSIFSKRFIIKSMQLVGAKNGFIMKPFLLKAILNGFLSSILALVLLGIAVYSLTQKGQLFSLSNDFTYYSAITIGLFLVGIFISLITAWLSVRKYLNAKIEELY